MATTRCSTRSRAVTDNRIFKQRNVDIGDFGRLDACFAWGFSGP
jgi:NADH:ubiquinone oxidoreductase subunit D